MAITSIKRDMVGDPAIVRILDSATKATITTAAYFASQSANILAIQHGAWTWISGDIVAINYSDGEGFFTYDSATDTFVVETDPGSLSETLPDGDVFVGSAANVATAQTMSGDATIIADGTLTVSAGAIDNAKVDAAAAIAFSKLAALADGSLLIGSAATVPTVKAMSGDATIDNAGLLTLGANVVSNAKLAVDTIQYAEVSIATAQVLLLATTPIELVAAPGAGLVNQFLGAELILDYATTQYTEAADNLVVKFENAAGVAVSEVIECTGFIDQAADTLTNAIPVKDNIVAATGCVNKALVLDNTNANFAVGDSPLRLKVTYKVVASGL